MSVSTVTITPRGVVIWHIDDRFVAHTDFVRYLQAEDRSYTRITEDGDFVIHQGTNDVPQPAPVQEARTTTTGRWDEPANASWFDPTYIGDTRPTYPELTRAMMNQWTVAHNKVQHRFGLQELDQNVNIQEQQRNLHYQRLGSHYIDEVNLEASGAIPRIGDDDYVTPVEYMNLDNDPNYGIPNGW